MDLSVRRECSRCPRVEHVEITMEEVVERAKRSKAGFAESESSALNIRVDGEIVADFSVLCTQCRGIVARHLQGVIKKSDKQSSMRETAEG